MRQLFSNLASNSSGSLEKSVNFQNPQTAVATRTAGCCERNRRRKAPVLSPAPKSAHRKSSEIRPKPARNPSPGMGCHPSLTEVTQRLPEANKGVFCAECLRAETAKPEEADVRVYSVRPLPLVSRPRRAAQPLPQIPAFVYCKQPCSMVLWG